MTLELDGSIQGTVKWLELAGCTSLKCIEMSGEVLSGMASHLTFIHHLYLSIAFIHHVGTILKPGSAP